MSYNISTIRIDGGTLSISKENYIILQKEIPINRRPECNFLDGEQNFSETTETHHVFPDYIWWSGEFSEWYFEMEFVKKVIPMLEGEAEMIIVWAGGDVLDFWWIKDGSYRKLKRV